MRSVLSFLNLPLLNQLMIGMLILGFWTTKVIATDLDLALKKVMEKATATDMEGTVKRGLRDPSEVNVIDGLTKALEKNLALALKGTSSEDIETAFNTALKKISTTKQENQKFSKLDRALFQTLEKAVDDIRKESCGDMTSSRKEVSAVFVQRTYSAKGGCTMRTGPTDPETLRSQYSWSKMGRLQISDVGPEKKSPGYPKGLRAYYIVPSDSIPSVDGNGTSFKITTHQNLHWHIDKATGDLELPKECRGTVKPTAMGNKGGLELKRCDNKLVIDVGWGKDIPERIQEGKSTIRDPYGNSCQVNNTSIFLYVRDTWKEKGKDYEYNQYGRFRTADEWFNFLTTEPQCSKLNLDFLKQKNKKAKSDANQSAPAGSGHIH